MTVAGPSETVTLARISYREGDVPEEVLSSAERAAASCGYDSSEEHLLACQVLDIRWVDEDSVRTWFPEFLDGPSGVDPAGIVRVDWQTCAIGRSFDGALDAAVQVRRESIIVAVGTLLAGEVFTYGMGPEYNWLHWEELEPGHEPLPDHVLESLEELVAQDWREEVVEHYSEDPGMLQELSPRLRQAVERVMHDDA